MPETKEILPTALVARTGEQDGSIIVLEDGRRFEVIRIHKGASKGKVCIEVENQDKGGVSMGELPDTDRLTVEV